MNRKKSLLFAAILLAWAFAEPNYSYSLPQNDLTDLSAQRSLTPEEEFIMAANAAKALRYAASARKNIAEKNISTAQKDVGQAIALMGQIKSRVSEARFEDLVEAARIRLSYEEPKDVIAYLETISPAPATLQDPAALKKVNKTFERAKKYLQYSDKRGADRELAALTEFLNYSTPARPVAFAENSLLAAASEFDQRRIESADRSIKEAEKPLELMATQIDTPLVKTKNSLWEAARKFGAGRLETAKGYLGQASDELDDAVKSATAETRSEIRELASDIRAALNASTQKQETLGVAIREFAFRSEALAQRALDYETAAWEKFQSHSPASKEVIEANLHVAYAQIYQFTSGDARKSATELSEAESHLKKAEHEMSAEAQLKLKEIQKQVTAAQTELAKNRPIQKKQYAAMKNELNRLMR
jgi:hypothetical protein